LNQSRVQLLALKSISIVATPSVLAKAFQNPLFLSNPKEVAVLQVLLTLTVALASTLQVLLTLTDA